VSAPSVVDYQPNSQRFVFAGWTGDIASTQDSVAIQLNGWKTTVKANYKTQYYLSVSSTVQAAVSASGWYDQGSTVTISAPPTIAFPGLLGILGARHVFAGWMGTISNTSTKVEFLMKSPHSITAVYEADYGGAFPAVIGDRIRCRSRSWLGHSPTKAGSPRSWGPQSCERLFHELWRTTACCDQVLHEMRFRAGIISTVGTQHPHIQAWLDEKCPKPKNMVLLYDSRSIT